MLVDGKPKKVSALLRQGAEVNQDSPKSGLTALHQGAKFCDPDLVEFLLKKKADACLVDRYGNTALHLFASQKQESKRVLELLLAHKVSLMAKTKKGQTALDIATEKMNTQCLEALIKAIELSHGKS